MMLFKFSWGMPLIVSFKERSAVYSKKHKHIVCDSQTFIRQLISAEVLKPGVWNFNTSTLKSSINASVAFEPIFTAWQTSQYDMIKSARNSPNTEIQIVDPLAKSKDDGSPNLRVHT